MSIKSTLEDLSKPTTNPNPSTFALGIAKVLITMMTQISFDPLKGSITVPGANDFLTQTTPGFVSLSAPPTVISLTGNLDIENSLQIFATVNVNSIDTKYLFEISKDYSFSKNSFSSTGNTNSLDNIDITTISNPLEPGTSYFYRLTLTNKNGVVHSNIMNIGTPVRKVNSSISSNIGI